VVNELKGEFEAKGKQTVKNLAKIQHSLKDFTYFGIIHIARLEIIIQTF